jgi:prolipoprotein diacylglyceryl transferase
MNSSRYIIWNIDPKIFQLGPFEVRWYGLFFALGIFIAFLLLNRIYKKENISIEKLDKLFIYVFPGIIIGARLGHCLFYDPSFYLTHPVEIIKVWKGGLASHGAAIGILIALYFYSKYEHEKLLTILDRLVFVVPLGGAFIRIGNLFNSEIIGKPTNVPWAFNFTRIDSLPRHPTQLYEAIAYLSIFILLFSLRKKNNIVEKSGFITGLFLILLFAARFLIEFFKENQSSFENSMPLNMGQLLSFPFILAGIFLLLKSIEMKPKLGK